MRRVRATDQIPASPDELFGFLADTATLPEWQTGIVSVRQVTPGAVRVGSVAHVVRELLGQRLEVDLTVTAYEPGRRLALRSSVSGIDVQATLALAPSGDGTRLTFEMTVRAQSIFMAPMEGMVAGAAERDLADSLARLRRRFSPPA
jgi:uncharacterized protein YndB with AHSA1/START domain